MRPERKEAMRQLAHKLGLEGKVREDRLSLALIHPSYAMERHGRDNQRLEFLGDAVVDLIIGAYLYENYPTNNEGQLTKMRATLVCESSLAAAGKRLGLSDYLLLGKGESACGGAHRPSNLADAFEALCGAIYLDCGVEPLMPLLANLLGPEIEMIAQGYYGDYKTRLQEYVQQIPDQEISYQLLEEIGPSHDKRFHMQVLINQKPVGSGWGRTKKAAERAAALEALKSFGQTNRTDE